MKKYLIILSTLVLFVFTSCVKDAGKPVTKFFNVEGTYTQLEVQNAFDVIVSETATQIEVTLGENVVPYLLVEQKDGKLKIYLKKAVAFTGKNEMKVVLPYNVDLESVNLSGASKFKSEFPLIGEKVEVILSGASDYYGDFLADKVDIELSGSSNFDGDIMAEEVNVVLSGASDAKLAGDVDVLKIDLSGSSNIVEQVVDHRYTLACERCQGEMSGSSEAYIHCDGTIKVDLSGGSELHFTGNAFTGDSSVSGGSKITHETL